MASPYTVTWPLTTLTAQSLQNGAPSQGLSTCTLSTSVPVCVCVCFFVCDFHIVTSPVLQFSSWKPVDRFHSHGAWKHLHSQKFVSSYSYHFTLFLYNVWCPFIDIELVEWVYCFEIIWVFSKTRFWSVEKHNA